MQSGACCVPSVGDTFPEDVLFTYYDSQDREETGLSTGFLPCGFIELATDEGYLEEFRRVAAFNRKCGVDVQEISPSEVERLFPLCKTDDVLAVAARHRVHTHASD